MKTLFLTLILLSTLISQTLGQKPNDQASILNEGAVSKEALSTLMITCYVCHNPRIKSEKDIIAPPLVAVKYIYKNSFPDKTDFINQVTDFVMSPNNQKARMQGPVMRFGVMPEMPLDEQQVRDIAAFIFDNKIEEPEWFPTYFENKHGMKWEGQ